jgi:NAD(P)-dependent dehydrogenase (short-subunit alcohol dehydrogenase family)
MTGASGGVSAGIARRRGEVGAGVVVHYRCDADGAAAVVDAMGAGSRAIAACAELLDRAALLSESTRFQRYGIGSPMLNDCCRATRPLAAPACGNDAREEVRDIKWPGRPAFKGFSASRFMRTDAG